VTEVETENDLGNDTETVAAVTEREQTVVEIEISAGTEAVVSAGVLAQAVGEEEVLADLKVN